MLTTCNVQKQLEQLSKDRNPFVADLTDFILSTKEVNSRISQRINALIEPHGQQQNDLFWFDLLCNTQEFPFASEDKNLNEETAILRLGEFIDSSFPEIESLNKEDSHESLRGKYLENLDRIYDELRRLMKREMVTQFVEIGTVDDSKKDKITFFDSIPASALTKIIQKINEFVNGLNIDMQSQLVEIEEAIKEVSKGLKRDFFPEITTLTNMYLNPILTLVTESKAVLLISQLESPATNAMIVHRIADIFSMLGQVSKGNKSTADLEGLFDMFEPFILASKSGSSFGSMKFKKMIPDIVQAYLITISKYVSPQKSFGYAKRFFTSIITVSSHVEIDSFIQELTQRNFQKYDISDDSSDDFMKNAIKVIDVINRVKWFDGMSEWWSNNVLTHFTKLQINPDIIESNELPKVLFIQNNLQYTDKPEYYDGLYDVVVRFITDNGENLSRTEWVFTFSEFLDSVSELNKEDVPEDLMEVYEFSKEWYFWTKLNALAYRTDVDENTPIKFVNILNENGVTNEESPSWVRFRTWLFPKCQKVGFINKPMSDFKLANGNKLSAKDAKGASYLIKLITRGEVPVNEFFKYSISENKIQQQEDKSGKGGIQRKQVEIGVKAGRAEGKLDLVKKKKTENKIVIPEEKIIEEVKIEHVSPKKEESPKREIENLITIGEVLAERNQEKQIEELPIEENVHEIDEEKENTNNNVIEQSPIRLPVIEAYHLEESPKDIENEEKVISLPTIEAYYKEESPKVIEKDEELMVRPITEAYYKEESPKVIQKDEELMVRPITEAYYKEESPKVIHKDEEFITYPTIDAEVIEKSPKVVTTTEIVYRDPNGNIIPGPYVAPSPQKDSPNKQIQSPQDNDKNEEFITYPTIDAEVIEKSPKVITTTEIVYRDPEGNVIPGPYVAPIIKNDSPKKPVQSPKIVKDIEEFNEDEDKEDDENSQEDIEQDDSPIRHDTPIGNVENIIHSIKGQLSPEEQDRIRTTPDLVGYSQRVETEVDPVTGDVTEYIYIQVVPKNSPCYDSVFE